MLNHYSTTVHTANKKWWEDPITGDPITRNMGELLALIHSEISEAFEGLQQNVVDSHLPHRSSEEVELVDVIIRVFDFCGGFRYDMDRAYRHLMGDQGLPTSGELDFFGLDAYSKKAFKVLGTLAPRLAFDLANQSDSEWYCEFHSAVSDALEGLRKGTLLEECPTILTAEVALARLLALIFAYSRIKDFDIESAYLDKMIYNSNRSDHQHSERAKDGGKKF